MDDGPVDGELLKDIGEAAGAALVGAAGMFQREYTLDRWLVNGRSGAPVAVVLEDDREADVTTRLVLKVHPAESGGPTLTEPARHRKAYQEAPKRFAKAHLASVKHDPVHVGAGSWITFQGVAGDDFESVEVMTVLLNGMLGATEAPGTVRCEPETFAQACGAIVDGVLRRWNGAPRKARKAFTVAEFLRTHLHDQLEPGGRLHTPSELHPEDTIELLGEPEPLPNPFALARGALFGDQKIVRTIVGRTHGDLHSDNVLLRVRPTTAVDDFHLIDLALYESQGPMTRDPVHLLLYILARRMDHVSGPEREALIKRLVDADVGYDQLLPGWLVGILHEIDTAATSWLKDSGLQPEWRQQRLLSLVGCGLLFLGRTSTRPEDHAWFLRLAARAAAAYVEKNKAALTDADGSLSLAVPQRLAWRTVPQAPSPVWLTELGLPRFNASAVLEVHAVPAGPTARLEARRLSTLKDELSELGRAESLFSPEDRIWTADPAAAGITSGTGLAVLQDGQRMAWQALPEDQLGAVLDEHDVSERISALVAAIVKMRLTRAAEVGLAVGVTISGLLSEGRVADLPRTAERGWSSRLPVRVPADDVLSFTYLEVRPRDVAEELAARLVRAFRAGMRTVDG